MGYSFRISEALIGLRFPTHYLEWLLRYWLGVTPVVFLNNVQKYFGSGYPTFGQRTLIFISEC